MINNLGIEKYTIKSIKVVLLSFSTKYYENTKGTVFN